MLNKNLSNWVSLFKIKLLHSLMEKLNFYFFKIYEQCIIYVLVKFFKFKIRSFDQLYILLCHDQ